MLQEAWGRSDLSSHLETTSLSLLSNICPFSEYTTEANHSTLITVVSCITEPGKIIHVYYYVSIKLRESRTLVVLQNNHSKNLLGTISLPPTPPLRQCPPVDDGIDFNLHILLAISEQSCQYYAHNNLAMTYESGQMPSPHNLILL